VSCDPDRPQAQLNGGDRRAIRPVHSARRSRPCAIGQRPEFIAKAVRGGSLVGAKTAYIEPGSAWENGYCESFNSKLRDELLNGEIFYSLK
jgi:hypothetical protein